MKQLSGLDAAFLFAETRNAPMHIGGLSIWDPSTAPGGVVRFKRIIQTMVERAHLAPHTRQRLFEVPYNTDFPFWVRDGSFDPEFHIRHLALPAPGDWRQLCIQIARIHARPLDRSRPLWETYVIEGLDNVEGLPPGSFATLSKTHHACVDGKSSNDIGTALSDLTPEIRQIPGGEDWRADIPPGPWELALKAQQHNAFKPVRYMEFLNKAIPAWVDTVQALVSGRVHGGPKVPRTRFNGTVSPHRVFEGVRYDLDEIRAIKSAAGATVNDVMLALCSGAMRRYLLDKQELPDLSLVSHCPVNVRSGGAAASGGNQVASMAVALRTDVEDPKQRLLAICEETRNAKELANAMDATTMVERSEFTSASMATQVARVAAEQGWANFLAPTFNTVITNVPGPQVPIYSNGARHIRSWGTGPCTDGNGLFQSIGSYCGEITLGVTCCREMMPDPEFYAQCLQDAFEELKVGMLGKARRKRRTVRKAAATRTRASAKSSAKRDTGTKAGGNAGGKTGGRKTAR